MPEDHNHPDGKTIELAWAVIDAKNPLPGKYPLIFLTGGPGGETLPIVPFFLELSLTHDRDLILFDQRGIGRSNALPDFGEMLTGILAADLSPAEEKDEIEKILIYYRDKAKEQGISLHHYNTFQNARDVGMLMEYLGYEKYHVMGGSYGSRLARVMIDKFPEYIESAVLDSPNPFENDFIVSRIKSYEQSLRMIFEQCESDHHCKSEYPNLETDYTEAIQSFADYPLKIDMDDFTFYVNPQDALFILRYQLYRADALNGAPSLIRAFKNRDKEHVRQNLNMALPMITDGNYSMFLSVERYEHYDPSIDSTMLDNMYQEMSFFPAPLALFTSLYLSAGIWHEHTINSSKKNFKQSDVPVLIFVNKYDPVTPPANGEIMMERLTNGHLFILDEGGHGEGNLECKIEVIRSFFDNSENRPGSGCLNIIDVY